MRSMETLRGDSLNQKIEVLMSGFHCGKEQRKKTKEREEKRQNKMDQKEKKKRKSQAKYKRKKKNRMKKKRI